LKEAWLRPRDQRLFESGWGRLRTGDMALAVCPMAGSSAEDA
jgi:hypothetical protein